MKIFIGNTIEEKSETFLFSSSNMVNSSRLYPAKIPFRVGEANKERFKTIINSKFGKCIISLVDFEIGQLVAILHTEMIFKVAKLHTVQIENGVHIYDPWFAGLITHSCEPNLILDTKVLCFFAIRKIVSGDILTQDYELTEDNLYKKFNCKCGSSHCRGEIKGKLYVRVSN